MSRVPLIGVLILILAACATETVEEVAGSASGLVVYVSVAGDDGNDGSSPDAAYRTLARALERIEPGDEVRVLPGTYYEGLTIEGLGAADVTTTIMGYDGIPVFDGDGREPLGLFCEECRNVVISCLEVTGYTDLGLGATNSTGIVLRDLVVHHNGSAPTGLGWGAEGYGIHVDDSVDVVIEYTDVHDNGPDPVVAGGPLLGTGINTFNLRNAVIKDNASYRNHGGGILVEDSVSVVVESNRVFDNDLDASADGWWDAGLWVDGGRDIVVSGNTFSGNLGPGIELSDEDGQNPSGYVLTGNVSTGNYFGVYVWGFGTDEWPAAVVESDNLFTGNEQIDVWIEPED